MRMKWILTEDGDVLSMRDVVKIDIQGYFQKRFDVVAIESIGFDEIKTHLLCECETKEQAELIVRALFRLLSDDIVQGLDIGELKEKIAKRAANDS